MGGAFALVLAPPRGHSCSSHDGAFATLLKHTVKFLGEGGGEGGGEVGGA